MFIHSLSPKSKTVLRKLVYKTLHISINAVLSFIIICLSPFLKIRIVNISSERIGHLALNTDSFLRKLQRNKSNNFRKILYIGIAQSPSANDQLIKMFSRELFIIQFPLKIYNLIKESIINNNLIYMDSMFGTYSEFELFNNTEVNLKFSPEENEKGIKLLKNMGISQDDWFICFQSRDSSYLKNNAGDLYGLFGSQRDWSYHGYRDCSIRNYTLAAEYIASKGGFVIRMGKDVDEPLPKDLHPRIIDYASCYWSDFGDIYLSAKCSFFLGSSAGLVVVPYIFHKPMIMANYIPLYDHFPLEKRTWLFLKKFGQLKRIGISLIKKYFILISMATQHLLHTSKQDCKLSKIPKKKFLRLQKKCMQKCSENLDTQKMTAIYK